MLLLVVPFRPHTQHLPIDGAGSIYFSFPLQCKRFSTQRLSLVPFYFILTPPYARCKEREKLLGCCGNQPRPAA